MFKSYGKRQCEEITASFALYCHSREIKFSQDFFHERFCEAKTGIQKIWGMWIPDQVGN